MSTIKALPQFLAREYSLRFRGDAGKLVIQPGLDLSHKILIGTHHRTGTVWMSKIFRNIGKEFGLRFHSGNGQPPSGADIILQTHSQFDWNARSTDYLGLHIIRDPRDLLVSGCFYHQKSNEKWLHVGRKVFGGLTYQEKINSYASFDDQLLFEMENAGKDNINEMLDWDYENPGFFEVKYEDLIKDVDLLLFHQIFTFLGFPGRAIPQALNVAYENSLFSGKITRSTHVRSGETRQWVQYFNAAHRCRFLELFGSALITLGYEDSHEWASA